MHIIGIDVGSTFTKYCVMQDEEAVELFAERTPTRQTEYFEAKLQVIRERYPDTDIISCGYGRNNVLGIRTINELTALAAGAYYKTGEDGVVLDIGGQDIKIIRQEKGKLREFFINDKCAAGSGMFLMNTLSLLGLEYKDIMIFGEGENISLSSSCAVFAQSEIVELISENKKEMDIINAVIKHILVKAKKLIDKIDADEIYISGGMSAIPDIEKLSESIFQKKCRNIDNGMFLASIGCCVAFLNA